MNFYVMTLFPAMIRDGMNHSVIKRAQAEGIIQITPVDIRDFSESKHRQVDDYPYGGGAGMVMQPQPVYGAYLHISGLINRPAPIVHLSPKGKPFSQALASQYALEKDLILLCGHYEGIDQRVLDEIVTEEVSIGDYILTGGELAAMVFMDAVSRLVPGVLGKEESFQDESFSHGLLEYPQYTRPPVFLGREVPEILLSGHHANIEIWRREKALEITQEKRPDLLL